jgi:hypothetical protein
MKKAHSKLALNQETIRILVDKTGFNTTTMGTGTGTSQISNCTAPCPPSVPVDACV